MFFVDKIVNFTYVSTMQPDAFKERIVGSRLPPQTARKLILLTGARQTGKTTLAKAIYPTLPYINFDAVEDRLKTREISTQAWAHAVGSAIIDEVQKEPQILDKVKYAFDAGSLPFSVLLGSSQIHLLHRVQESLAGRVSLYHIYPFMLCELSAHKRTLSFPLISHILSQESLERTLHETPPILFGEEELLKKEAQAYLLRWGGMPALIHLGDEEKKKWLRDYEYTYLERDLSDLARLNDLQPFRTFQKIAALRSGNILNYSELARDTGISVDTARRYLEYLKLSYQTAILRPYFHNRTTTLIKTPKLYWLDMGMWRQLSGCRSEINGQAFETFVVSEWMKWVNTSEQEADCYFYRTRGGLEIDLFVELPQGVLGVEIKARQTIAPKDMTALREVGTSLKKRWFGGLVIYNGNSIQKIGEPNIWAMPAWRLFS